MADFQLKKSKHYLIPITREAELAPGQYKAAKSLLTWGGKRKPYEYLNLNLFWALFVLLFFLSYVIWFALFPLLQIVSCIPTNSNFSF